MDAGSIPAASTNHKGSEILRALFLCRIPRVARGSGLECCGWHAARMSRKQRTALVTELDALPSA